MKTTLLILLIAGLSLLLPALTQEKPKGADNTASETPSFPTVEHDGIFVTLLEQSVSRSPDRKQAVTSFLFMVENRNKNPGMRHAGSPLRMFSTTGELHHDATSGAPKTWAGTIRYNKQELPKFSEIPEPADGSNVYLRRHQVQAELPQGVVAIEASFGRDGKLNSYRFPVHRR